MTHTRLLYRATKTMLYHAPMARGGIGGTARAEAAYRQHDALTCAVALGQPGARRRLAAFLLRMRWLRDAGRAGR